MWYMLCCVEQYSCECKCFGVEVCVHVCVSVCSILCGTSLAQCVACITPQSPHQVSVVSLMFVHRPVYVIILLYTKCGIT